MSYRRYTVSKCVSLREYTNVCELAQVKRDLAAKERRRTIQELRAVYGGSIPLALSHGPRPLLATLQVARAFRISLSSETARECSRDLRRDFRDPSETQRSILVRERQAHGMPAPK